MPTIIATTTTIRGRTALGGDLMAPATACVRLAKGVLRFTTADVYEFKIHSAGGEWYRQLPVGL